MKIAGKTSPEAEQLSFIEEETDFENVELYLEKRHLEEFEDTVSNIEGSELEVVSVHTPHVTLSELEYFSKADRLAEEFDAFLVCHSEQMLHFTMPEVEAHGLKAEHGYENQPGASIRHLKAAILDRGAKMVLDTAHLYTAESGYIERIGELLSEHGDHIPLIHLCDSTLTEDGLPFGEGDMKMEQVCEAIRASGFDGILVFEVMPEHQQEAFERWKGWIKN